MKQHAKRFFALLLTVATIATLLVAVPMTATAAEEENVLPNGWKVVAEDFDGNDVTVNSSNYSFNTKFTGILQ